jgi:hypothetical protein
VIKIRILFEYFRLLYFVITNGLTVSDHCPLPIVVVVLAVSSAALCSPEVSDFESHLEVQSTLASHQENIVSLYPYHTIMFFAFVTKMDPEISIVSTQKQLA